MGDVISMRARADQLELDFANTVVDLARHAPVARQVAVLRGMETFDKMLAHALGTKDDVLVRLLCELGYAIHDG